METIEDILARYKYHPRLMELRLSVFKNIMIEQYGIERGMILLRKMADMFECNWGIIAQVFNHSNRVLHNRMVSATRKRQEMVFMGESYGETRYFIAEKFLGITPAYLYQNKNASNPKFFVDKEWLDTLDNEVVLLTHDSYSLEVKKFLLSIDILVHTFK